MAERNPLHSDRRVNVATFGNVDHDERSNQQHNILWKMNNKIVIRIKTFSKQQQNIELHPIIHPT